jgi:hypothetical protein
LTEQAEVFVKGVHPTGQPRLEQAGPCHAGRGAFGLREPPLILRMTTRGRLLRSAAQARGLAQSDAHTGAHVLRDWAAGGHGISDQTVIRQPTDVDFERSMAHAVL